MVTDVDLNTLDVWWKCTCMCTCLHVSRWTSSRQRTRGLAVCVTAGLRGHFEFRLHMAQGEVEFKLSFPTEHTPIINDSRNSETIPSLYNRSQGKVLFSNTSPEDAALWKSTWCVSELLSPADFLTHLINKDCLWFLLLCGLKRVFWSVSACF